MKTLKNITMIACVSAAMFAAPATMAQEAASTAANVKPSVTIGAGFRWDHCQQTYHAVGATTSYCYLETARVWVYETDDRAEEMFQAATADNNWLGVNIKATCTNYCRATYYRLYKS